MSQLSGDERPHLLAQSLRRFAAVVLLAALLGGAGAAAYASSLPESFTSSSRILLRPSTGNPFSSETGSSGQQVTIAMTTEAALVNSDPVLKVVNEKLSPDLLGSAVSVSVPPNTSTILARVEAPTAAQAQQGAQAVADGYLAYRSSVTAAARKAQVDQLNRQIGAARASLAKASQKASADPTDGQAARQAQVLTEQIISLQDLLNTAESIDSDPGTLVSPAAPGTRTGIPPALIIAAGVLLGLMVGMALALGLGRRDRRVHATMGSTVAGVPVLAVLGGRRRGVEAVASDRQAFQRLRTSVLASSALPSAVAMSGVSPEDRSSFVALELGHSMIRAGYRVVLVVASAEEPGPFTDDARGSRGLADVLRGGRKATDLLVEHEGLSVLSAGSGIIKEQELLSGERFGRVVKELKAEFDYVLVVTGPAVLPAELATARLADSLLLVGRDGVTSRIDVADVASRARLVGLSVSGLVLRSRDGRGGRPSVDVAARTARPPRSGATAAAADGLPDAAGRERDARIAAKNT